MAPDAPVRVFVFDSPRTRSQVFNKLFQVHPQLETIFHPMLAASAFGPERLWLHLQSSDDAADQAYKAMVEGEGLTSSVATETYAVAAERLESVVKEIEAKGKFAFMKEHTISDLRTEVYLRALRHPEEIIAGGNPTAFSDEFLGSLTPIFLIRHPAFQIPSWHRGQRPIFHERPGDEDFEAMASQRWVRMVFDFYRTQHEQKSCRNGEVHAETGRPYAVVIDSQDLVRNGKATVNKVCSLLGLDPEGVQYEWDVLPKDQWPPNPMMQALFSDMLASSCLGSSIKPAETHVNIDDEQKQWIAEFGEEAANAIRVLVDKEVVHYEYLKQFKLCA